MAGFQPAVKSQAKARIGVYGVGGSGKTMAAHLIARGLRPPDAASWKVAVIDTEAGKSAVYADEFPFDIIVMRAPFATARFAAGINEAAKHNYDVLIVDGISPFWSGPGGVQTVVDEAKKRGGGWAEGSPAQNVLVQAIGTAPMHLIVTMRAKNDTVVDRDPNGKTTLRKVGLKYDQRDTLEYELGWLLYAEHNTHNLVVEKTHMLGQQGVVLMPVEGSDSQPAEELGRTIAEWLGSGAAQAPPAQTPSPAPAAPPDPNPPAPTSEAGRSPENAPSGDDGGLAELAGAPPALLDAAQLAQINAKIVELKRRKPTTDWDAAILGKLEEWYGVAAFAELSAGDAAQLIERLTSTLLRVPATPVEA